VEEGEDLDLEDLKEVLRELEGGKLVSKRKRNPIEKRKKNSTNKDAFLEALL